MGSSNEVTILLDTNMLISIFKFRIDLESELERIFGTFKICVPGIVREELLRMNSSEAKAALDYIKDKEIDFELKGKSADDVMLLMAKRCGFFIATNDRELRKKAKENNIKTIFLRKKRVMAVD
jgi:Uncharacterized proteins of PilT N-term./Vapc superfamily